MSKVQVRISTESGEVFYKTFTNNPTKEQVARYAWSAEGKCEDFQFYLDTVRFEIVPNKKKKGGGRER